MADTNNNVVRKITQNSIVSTLAGNQTPRTIDGAGTSAEFTYPGGIASGSQGNLYVTDQLAIRKITPANVVATLAGSASPLPGTNDGTGANASFSEPTRLATDHAGNLYVVDRSRAVRKVTPEGVVTTIATSINSPSNDGTTYGPFGVATDVLGNVYIGFNHVGTPGSHFLTSSAFIKKISPNGDGSVLAGSANRSGSVDGDELTASFSFLNAMVADNHGNLYVLDAGALRAISSDGKVTTLKQWTVSYPAGIALDSHGYIYASDVQANVVYRISPQGEASIFVGESGASGYADGIGAAARLSAQDIVFDDEDNLYVADGGNNVIRKVTPDGVVTTVIGTPGLYGFMPGPLPGVLKKPTGVALSGRTLYVSMQKGVARVSNVP
ncbi:MAG: hypothetical protein IPG66_17995 [Hydrogenophilales bacterium]|nr:hypothetical protein [Hydrogenophilales bacterium]